MKTRYLHASDPIPADLLFWHPQHSSERILAARAEITRELDIFQDDNDAEDHERDRIARGLLGSRGM
jgi:hypothetical protein